jgi:hypothetical protein
MFALWCVFLSVKGSWPTSYVCEIPVLELKIKLSLPTLWRHTGRVDVCIHSFSSSAPTELHGYLHASAAVPLVRNPGTQRKEAGWVPEPVCTFWRKQILPLPAFTGRTFQLVAWSLYRLTNLARILSFMYSSFDIWFLYGRFSWQYLRRVDSVRKLQGAQLSFDCQQGPHFVLITLMSRLSKSDTQLPYYPQCTTVSCRRWAS